MPRKGLKRAKRLFRVRKFPEVIRLLEPQIFRFRENFDFYYILGVSCLYTGDLEGALSYLKRADQLKSNTIDVMTGIAAVHFKRGETEDALRIWLDILDIDGRNRKARFGLNLVKNGLNSEELLQFVESGRLKRLFPKLPFTLPIFVPILIVCALIAIGVYFYVTNVKSRPRDIRPGLENIGLEASDPALEVTDLPTKFTLSEKEIVSAFNKAKMYLQDYRDNLARREINRILLSNASTRVKEESSLLASMIETPDFSTVKDPFPFENVVEEPLLFNGCYVVWEGKLANVDINSDRILFDLLVGYQSEKELLGVVSVSLNFGANLSNGMALRVLGSVVSDEEGFTLEGISIQKIYSTE